METKDETKSKFLAEIKTKTDEVNDKFVPMLRQSKKCVDYYTGDQALPSNNSDVVGNETPAIRVNHIRKPVDVVTGYVQQNKSDLRCFPIGARDTDTAEALSAFVKWLFDDCSGHYQVGKACKDAVIGGIGWVQAYIDYTDDFQNGDIIIERESPFRIFPDPASAKPDFSDARYILRIDYLSKEDAKNRWPEVAEDIELLGKKDTADAIVNLQKPQAHKEESLVKVVEYWYMVWEKKYFFVEGESVRFIEEKQVKEAKEMGKEVIERRVKRLKLAISLNDTILAYDGYSPYGIDKYPFVPYMFYYTPSADKWEKKFQGLVFDLTDIQDEINKYRQKAMASALQMPDTGYIFEEGAVENESCFYTKQGGMTLIKTRPGGSSRISPLNPRQISPQMLEAMNSSKQDIREVGPNPDMMGMKNESGAPGVAIQLRQQQGIVAVQDPFENFSYSTISLGKLILEYMRNVPIQKIADICELEEIPEGYQRFVEGLARFDCKVDEVNVSPTMKLVHQMELQQLEQGGVPIPPQVKIENANLPRKVKEQLLLAFQQMQQQPPQGFPQPTE